MLLGIFDCVHDGSMCNENHDDWKMDDLANFICFIGFLVNLNEVVLHKFEGIKFKILKLIDSDSSVQYALEAEES